MKRAKTSKADKSKPARGKRVKVEWKDEKPFPVPIPANEPERIAELRDFEVLDTPPEEAFDTLTHLASHICGTPIALITLIDSDRQWFKSKVGVSLSESSRDIALCAHAIMEEDLFIIPDALLDKRFARNPLVRSRPRIRFYAGAPLITRNRHALGTLCVIDLVPRKLTKEQRNALRALSRQVMAQLESRRTLRKAQRELVQKAGEESQLQRQINQAIAQQRSWEEACRRLNHEVRATTHSIMDLVDQDLNSRPDSSSKAALKSIRSLAESLLERAK